MSEKRRHDLVEVEVRFTFDVEKADIETLIYKIQDLLDKAPLVDSRRVETRWIRLDEPA